MFLIIQSYSPEQQSFVAIYALRCRSVNINYNYSQLSSDSGVKRRSKFMISAVNQEDLKEIQSLISKSILTCIDVSEAVADDLIYETVQESEYWLNNQESGVHLVYRENDTILGVILIKEYWNMTGLFVCPSVQKSGVASNLVSRALILCREHSPINAVKLNSSSYASGFYAKFGFKRNGVSKDLPGGCIPYVYSF